MSTERTYPDEPAGPFPEPPLSITDREDRSIEIRPYGGELEPLVAMYDEFDPSDRAQGIPPSGERRIRDWLETILEDSLNVVAWHGERAAGHATLVPGPEDDYELAIFVLQKYQRAGIGEELMRGLLGHGQANGVEYIWLTVERWNTPAINLYKKVGFVTCGSESFEVEMSLRLD